jgi:hypothetical protein
VFDLTNLAVEKTSFNKRKPYNTFIFMRLLDERFDSARETLWDIAGDRLAKVGQAVRTAMKRRNPLAL